MEDALVLSIYDKTLINGSVMVGTEDVFNIARRIVREEGIFAGMSSGATMYALSF